MPPSSNIRRRKRGSWIRSSGCCWRWRGRRSRTPGNRRAARPSLSACSPDWAGWSAAILSIDCHSALTCRATPAPSRISATTRISPALEFPTSSTSPGRASTYRPPVRPHWWPCTSPARRFSRANATWRWRAPPACACPSASATPASRAASSHPTDIAAPSTPTRRARFSAAASAPSCSRILAAAVADGNHIYAVIRGSAINNDGADKVSYTASSVAGQARAMVEALHDGRRVAGRHCLCRVPWNRHRQSAIRWRLTH